MSTPESSQDPERVEDGEPSLVGGNRLTRLESSSDHPDGLGATGGFITPVGVWTFHKPSKTASSEETFDPDVESRRWTGAAPGHNRAGSQLGATSEKSDTQRPTYQCLVLSAARTQE